jgi:hypothetical protein
VQLEAQVSEKNKNKKTEVQRKRKRITFGKWRAANVGRKSTAALVVLSRSQNLQTKTGSSVVLVRNGGMKNARHMKGEILFVTCDRSCLFNKLMLFVYKVYTIKYKL